MSLKRSFELSVDGVRHRILAHPLERLLDVLREGLRLTGTKEGCGEGECGACTVLIDGQPLNSCLIPVGQVEGSEITTVASVELSRIAEAFLREGGTQCGICTPGMIVMTRAFLAKCEREGRAPSAQDARQALAGNLCRCTGYGKILAAALAAAREAADEGGATDA